MLIPERQVLLLSTSFCLDAKGTKTNFIEAPTLSIAQVSLTLLSLKRCIQDYARFARKTYAQGAKILKLASLKQ
ncbi:hypothetical protein D0T49_09040 [Paludibacter sp. 221]|nr:hypothetical protein [Paludibacter sp. 221]